MLYNISLTHPGFKIKLKFNVMALKLQFYNLEISKFY